MGVTFIEDGHLYLNSKGIIIPSVSQLVNFACGDAYKGVPKRILSAKADYGTQVHDYIQQMIEGNLNMENFHYRKINPYIKEAVFQTEKLITKYMFKIASCEVMVDYEERYAGRYDLMTKDEFLIDIKTTVKLHEDRLAWQLGFYYLALGLNKEIGYCLHLPKNERGKVHLIRVKSNKECLELLEKYEIEKNKSNGHTTKCEEKSMDSPNGDVDNQRETDLG